MTRVEWVLLEEKPGVFLERGRVYNGAGILGELTLLLRKRKRAVFWNRSSLNLGPVSGTKIIETMEEAERTKVLAEEWVAGGMTDSASIEPVATVVPTTPLVIDIVTTVNEDGLSSDQQTALSSCLTSLAQGRETILVGPAGSGKSTLVGHIIKKFGRHPVLICPTGKAALRLSQVTGLPSSTIHRRLYGSVEEDGASLSFGSPHAPCLATDLLVVDEASMVGKQLYTELMDWVPKGTPVLFIGDSAQLEPVKDTWGPDLKRPTVALTQIHRQAADRPLIQFATAVRHGLESDWLGACYEPDPSLQFFGQSNDLLRWYLDRREAGADNVLITYTHEVRQRANRAVRHAYKFEASLCPGDRILVRTNNHRWGLMNGEILTVTNIEPLYQNRVKVWVQGRGEPILINQDLIEQEPSDFWSWWKSQEKKDVRYVHVWYGNCITVHSSQGSQWDEVGLLWCDNLKRLRKRRPEEGRRLLYTAITRAAEVLGVTSV